MKYIRTLSSEEIIEKTCDDSKVLAALDDLIRAMSVYGRNEVTGSHLLDAIAWRLQVWAEHEEELDGE